MPNNVGYGGVIARFTGKVFVAAGFILGIYGLTEKQDAILNTGLGLLAAGVTASAYGLYHWVRWKGVTTDSDGPHRS